MPVNLAIHCWSGGWSFRCDMGQFGPAMGAVGFAVVAVCLLGATLSLALGTFSLATGRFPGFLPATRSRVRTPGAIRLGAIGSIVLSVGFVGLAWEFFQFGQGRFPVGPLSGLYLVPVTMGLTIQGLALLFDQRARRG